MNTIKSGCRFISRNELWPQFILHLSVLLSIFIGLYIFELYLLMLISGIILSLIYLYTMVVAFMLDEDLRNIKYMNTELSKRLMEMMR